MLRRSQLFVPANEEKKIRKSISLPADSIVFDLEDAVPPEAKSQARETLKALLKELDWGSRELCVRVNKLDQGYSRADLDFVKSLSKISTIMLPKIEEVPSELDRSGKEINALIETAKGLANLSTIASAKGISALSFGPQDFANSVGGSLEAYRMNVFVKTSIAVTAKAWGLDPIDGVFFELTNLDGFREEAKTSRDLGYVGKQVVHPAQIEIANSVFGISEEDASKARKLVETYEKASKENIGALRIEDKLVDAVHYREAKAILERAREEGKS
jgi:citrate lyase subunit beta/citryl-CoA lyase